MKRTKTMQIMETAEPNACVEQESEESSRGAKLVLQIEELEARLAPGGAAGAGGDIKS